MCSAELNVSQNHVYLFKPHMVMLRLSCVREKDVV